jgi:MFS family permease
MRSVYRSSLPEPIKKSLEACWKEGVAAQVMIGILDYYLIPYALFLGADVQQIGLLVAVPNLLSAVSQLCAVGVVRLAGSRRRLLIGGIFLQAALLIPVALLPYAPVMEKIWPLMLFITGFKVIGGIIGPALGSLVSDYLPEGQRGQYLGWRAGIVGVAGIAGIAFWGLLLYYLQKTSGVAGFAALFAGAAAFRFISLYFMAQMTEVPVPKSADSDFTFWMFVRRVRQSNFVKFVLYVSAITFATQLAAPFFSVHMLKNLGFDYLSYMAVHLAPAAIGFLAFPIWGRHADAVGNARILKATAGLIPFIPLLWLFVRRPVTVVVVEMIAGFIWAGFNLAAANFIYDAVSPAKRVRCLAYFNVITGVMIFLGATLGGWLATRLPPIFGYRLLTLFLISSGLRFLADLILEGRFEEVRKSAADVSSTQLFLSVSGIRPMFGRNVEPDVSVPIRLPRQKVEKPPNATELPPG